MKYIITESQYKTLQEVGIKKGTFKISPVKYLWTFINGFSERKRVNAFRNYYTKVVGANVSDLSDDNILEFYDELDELGTSALPKNLKSRNILSGFAFYLATKFTKLKNGRGLVYFIEFVYIVVYVECVLGLFDEYAANFVGALVTVNR